MVSSHVQDKSSRWHEEFFINPLACPSSHFCWVLNFVVLNFHPIESDLPQSQVPPNLPKKPSFDMHEMFVEDIVLSRKVSFKEWFVMIWWRPIKKPVISSDFVARIPLLRSEDSKELVPILPHGHTLYDKYLHCVHQVKLHLLLNKICPPTEVSSCHFWGGILVTENAVGGLFFFL